MGARYLNGLIHAYVKHHDQPPSEKTIQTVLAVELAANTEASQYFDLEFFTWGPGVRSDNYHLISPQMQHWGGYRVYEKRGKHYLVPESWLTDPSEISEISQGIIKIHRSKRFIHAFKSDLQKGIDELTLLFCGLFEDKSPYTLKQTALNTPPVYTLPQLIQPSLLIKMLKRTVELIKADPPTINEKDKNNEQRLILIFNEYLHSIAMETVAGLVKCISYLSVWEHGEFLKELNEHLPTLPIEKPSEQNKTVIEQSMIYLGLRRWQIAYVRSKLNLKQKRSPMQYVEWFNALKKSAQAAGIPTHEPDFCKVGGV
jgi:hypothetical protein